MSAQPDSATARVMDRITEERDRDRRVRRIARVAWIATFIIVFAWIVMTAFQIKAMAPVMGGVGALALLGIATPVLFVLLGLSVLIATLSTIGSFLRERRATFEEIQLRLAALEELLTTRGGAP
jgi:hypothetical protein